MSNFEKAFDLVVGAEGGYVNDPRDPGGETKYGICKRSYPSTNIAQLTLDDAKRIYRRDFWEQVSGDSLPWPLAMFVFDAAVNQGVRAAKLMLQRSLGVVADGVLGPATLQAAGRAGVEVTALFMAERAMRYAETANYDRFGRGWMKRLFKTALEV